MDGVPSKSEELTLEYVIKVFKRLISSQNVWQEFFFKPEANGMVATMESDL